MNDTGDITITVPAAVSAADLVGPADAHLRLVEESFDAAVSVRGDSVTISGDADEAGHIAKLLSDFIDVLGRGEPLTEAYVRKAIDLCRTAEFAPSAWRDDVLHVYKGKAIRPKTAGQKRYVDAIRSHVVTFGIGPAGTGKTYLAMAMALSALSYKEVGRIILTRPIVEAGENLGFLPGTLTEKVDPYIRPLYDALFAMMDGEKARRLIEQGTIEIAPLAFMRGRTLDDSFVILDEAQNATPEQMKMFLTRLGFGSRMVVTGDVTQTDLPRGASGLAPVESILQGIPQIAFCHFSGTDVVRHSLVGEIIAAYARAEERKSCGHTDQL